MSSDGNELRLFLALPIPEELRRELKKIQRDFDHYSLKWVKVKKIHLTLKFIGNFPSRRLEELSQVVEESKEGISPFELDFKDLGCFPNLRRPKVFWVGAQKHESLLELATRLDKALAKLEVDRESRDYHPHLTLARMPRRGAWGNKKDFASQVKDYSFSHSMEVGEFHLFESTLTPQGAIYEVRDTFALEN